MPQQFEFEKVKRDALLRYVLPLPIIREIKTTGVVYRPEKKHPGEPSFVPQPSPPLRPRPEKKEYYDD